MRQFALLSEHTLVECVGLHYQWSCVYPDRIRLHGGSSCSRRLAEVLGASTDSLAKASTNGYSTSLDVSSIVDDDPASECDRRYSTHLARHERLRVRTRMLPLLLDDVQRSLITLRLLGLLARSVAETMETTQTKASSRCRSDADDRHAGTIEYDQLTAATISLRSGAAIDE